MLDAIAAGTKDVDGAVRKTAEEINGQTRPVHVGATTLVDSGRRLG
jgi:hypothetical protein